MKMIKKSVIDKPENFEGDLVVIMNPEGDIIINADITIKNCPSVTFIAKNIYQNSGVKIMINDSCVQMLTENAFYASGNIKAIDSKLNGYKLFQGTSYRDSDITIANSTFIFNEINMTHISAKDVLVDKIKWFLSYKKLKHVDTNEHHIVVQDNCPRGFIPSFSQNSTTTKQAIRNKIFDMIKGKKVISDQNDKIEYITKNNKV